jgi:hypothetical protein
LDLHHQEMEDMEEDGADEDVDIEGGKSQSPLLAWILSVQEDHLPPSLVLPRLLVRCQG